MVGNWRAIGVLGVALTAFALLLNSCQQVPQESANVDPADPYKGFAYIADVRGVDVLEDYRQVNTVLKRHGIRAITEGTMDVFSVSVAESNVVAAVNAIAKAPELKGLNVQITARYLPLITDAQYERPGGSK